MTSIGNAGPRDDANGPAQYLIRNTLSVAGTGPQERHVLTTVYPESDPLNAGAQVLQVRGAEELTRSVLRTSRPVCAMWRCAHKQLWLASADGSAWTTAATAWDVAAGDDVIVDVPGRWTWRATALPALPAAGTPPNLTGVWGSSQTNVFFLTASGAIYRWDGRRWTTWQAAGGHSLTKIHGIDDGLAYAVGYGATIVHWNGQDWRRIDTGLDPDTTIVTGIAVQRSGAAYAVTNRGQLLTSKGPGGPFVIAATADARFTGLTVWKGVLAIASTEGAWLYSSNGLRKVKGDLDLTDVMVVRNELHFIESEQRMGPSVIEYRARRSETPWQRVVF